MLTPSGIVASPAGGFYVSSVFTGVINEYDRRGRFVRTILQPPAGETLGSKPFSTGTPLGIGIAPDGTIYYADIGIVIEPRAASVPARRPAPSGASRSPTASRTRRRRWRAASTIPDGIGIFVPPN